MSDSYTSIMINGYNGLLVGVMFFIIAKQTWFFQHPLGRIITPILVTFLGFYFLMESFGSFSYLYNYELGMMVSAYGRAIAKVGIVWTAINMQKRFG